MTRRRMGRREPARPVVPQGQPDAPCAIVFGHNVSIKKVLMQFSVTADRLVFDPDVARDVARKLLHYADMADGKKVQG